MDWCRPDAQGVCTGTNVPTPARTVPGVSVTIPGSLESPHALEYAAGISRKVGDCGSVRADVMYRDYRYLHFSGSTLRRGLPSICSAAGSISPSSKTPTT